MLACFFYEFGLCLRVSFSLEFIVYAGLFTIMFYFTCGLVHGAVFPAPGIQQILDGSVTPDLRNLPFGNPDNFVAGQLHQDIYTWESIFGDSPTHQLISDWITNKVDVERFVVPFRGKFRGVFYDCPFPPTKVFPNNPSCKKYAAFISETLLQRTEVGAVLVWGQVGKAEPPYIVLPFTVKPSQPLLCQDARFLNLLDERSAFLSR